MGNVARAGPKFDHVTVQIMGNEAGHFSRELGEAWPYRSNGGGIADGFPQENRYALTLRGSHRETKITLQRRGNFFHSCRPGYVAYAWAAIT